MEDAENQAREEIRYFGQGRMIQEANLVKNSLGADISFEVLGLLGIWRPR
jgi:hypothetical protein